MALLLTKASGFGVDVQYHRLGIVNHHPINNSCQVVLFGYASQQARDDGAKPLTREELTLDRANVGGGSLQEVYTAIKALPAYAEATDC